MGLLGGNFQIGGPVGGGPLVFGGGVQPAGPGIGFAPPPATPQLPGAELGVDISCTNDLDPFGTYVSGQRAVGQALFRRLITARGSLVGFPDYGTDVRQWLSGPVDAFTLAALKGAIEGECEQDERVTSCEATVTWDPVKKTLTILVAVETSAGSLSLVLGVTSATTSLLSG